MNLNFSSRKLVKFVAATFCLCNFPILEGCVCSSAPILLIFQLKYVNLNFST